MAFDIAQVDHLLTTTRSVRRRLDLETPVSDEVLLRLIDIAEQAPSGSNQPSRRWLIVRDPALKKRIAELYREASLPFLQRRAATVDHADPGGRRVFSSALYLAENLEHVPALVLVAIHGTHDGSGRPGLFDSVLQAAWSFCLAARARGLGTAWTTLHLHRAAEVADLLGIPTGVTQVVLLPVAHAPGEFRPVARRPAHEITYFDHWGLTDEGIPAVARAHPGEGRGVRVELDIDAAPEEIWPLVTDIGLPARFSGEAAGATWDDPGPGPGGTFRGRNACDDTGHPALDELLRARLGGRLAWETPCHVTRWEPGRDFTYVVGDPADPSAEWGFRLQQLVGGGTRVTAAMTMRAHPSGTALAMAANPAAAEDILVARLLRIRRNLQRTLAGIAGGAPN